MIYLTAGSVQLDMGSGVEDSSLAAYCLLLPGRTLNSSALLAAKRFRDKGNKDGAVRGIKMLQAAGLGEVIEKKPLRGTSIVSVCMYVCMCDNVHLIMHSNFA